MEGYGLVLFYFILAFALFSLYFFLINKNKKKIISYYNKIIDSINIDAKCVLICRYVEGIDDLVTNASCFLFANEEKLTIIPIDYLHTRISVDITKIKSFQFTNKVLSNITVMGIRPKTQNSITLLYLSKNNEIREIVFSTVLSLEEDRFDKYALSQCNLYTFVTARIPKQETTIEL